VVQIFFGPDLFLKTHFCEKKMCCFWTKIAQIFLFFCKSAIFDQKPARFFQVVTKANYWQIFDKFLTTFHHFLTIFDNFLTTFWQLFDNFLTFVWHFLDNFLTIFWQLFDNFLTTFWHLFDIFLTIFWRYFDNFLKTFWQFFTTFWQLLTIFWQFWFFFDCASQILYTLCLLHFLMHLVSEIFSSCSHKNTFYKKGHDQNIFAQLFSDSAYSSNAKATFRMFGMICFGADSQTHTLWSQQEKKSCKPIPSSPTKQARPQPSKNLK
jgi:hypothetical protein